MKTLDTRVEAVRRFSRFYTRQLGLLQDGILESPFSLTEARVIYELAHGEALTATDIGAALGVDLGYLSRVLRSLERRRIVGKRRSETDRRRVLLNLTATGAEAFSRLNAGSHDQIEAMLSRLTPTTQRDVVKAMQTVEHALGDTTERRPKVRLRPHRPGDIGWVIQRHGELYLDSHGWDVGFEALCAEIGAAFLAKYDPAWERSWIAEKDGERAGAVFLVRRSKTVGQLRMLFVEPGARGLGIGQRLVSECVSHARHVGYRKMTLFTVRGLDAARRLYEAEGFALVHEEAERAWGHDHIAQTWELTL